MVSNLLDANMTKLVFNMTTKYDGIGLNSEWILLVVFSKLRDMTGLVSNLAELVLNMPPA